MSQEEKKVRIDKWLWAARFFKTRSAAAKAVSGGQVHVNGQRVKPAKNIEPGEELRIHRGEQEFIVVVEKVSDRRGPAVVARTLYTETEESVRAREEKREQRRLLGNVPLGPISKPDKRTRRLIRKFTRKD